MIVKKEIKTYLKQTKLLYGEEIYLKQKKKKNQIDLIIVTEYPNYNPITHKINNFRYEKLFKRIIKSIDMKINHDTVVITVLENNPDFPRAPIKKEIEAFKIRLDSYIKLNKPKIILGFGKTVGKSLTGIDIALEEMRNLVFDFKKIPVKITYDPLSIINNEDFKKPLWTDLKLIKNYLVSGNYNGK